MGSRVVVLLAIAALAPTGGGGCQDRVGRICDLGGSTDGEAVLASPSLDCPTRECLKIPVQAGKDLPDDFQSLPANRGLCTARCENDDGCVADESTPCVTGFTCAVALVTGPYCCQKVCICRDYVVVPASGTLPRPAACDPGNPANGCCNLAGRAGDPDYPDCP